MLISIFLLFFLISILWWFYCGYLLFLFLYNRFKGSQPPRTTGDEELPGVYIIVPTYNEEELVRQKINNINQTTIATEKLHVIFIDGGSTDNTPKIIQKLIKNRCNWQLIRSSHFGKINQLNFALGYLDQIDPSSIIINTDVDALLASNSVELIVKMLTYNPSIGVVGGNITPSRFAIKLEAQHWRQQNQMRMIESSLYSCSSVVAPCYGFKRSLLKRFPDDCIADDLYLAYYANSKGLLVKYLPEAKGEEIRVPQRHLDYIAHKFRKTNACLREGFRFLSLFSTYPSQWKLIYSVKFMQLILCPFITAFFIIYSILLLFKENLTSVIVIFGWMLFFAGMTITTPFLLRVMEVKKNNGINGDSPGSMINLFSSLFLMILIITSSVIIYPFYKQDSHYSKVSSRQDRV